MRYISILWLLIITSSHYSLCQVPNYVPQQNELIGWWPLDVDANDISGNDNHGVFSGNVQPVSDHFGNINGAMSVGCIDRILFEDMDTSPVDGQVSISIWYKNTGDCHPSDKASVLQIYSPPGGNSALGSVWWLWDDATNENWQWKHAVLDISLNNYVNLSPGSTLPVQNGDWIHFVYTNDGTVAKWYQNGVLIQLEANPANSLIRLGHQMILGGQTFSFNQAMAEFDDIGIWSTALNIYEVNNLYSGAVGLKENSESIISAYPNPTNGTITISGTMPNWEIVVFDSFGQKLSSSISHYDLKTIELAGYDSGLYYILVFNQNGAIVGSSKIIFN